ncbi:pyridoxamine 5'-phosphate oxidase family protein [Actinomadura luteofluorescens]|uniref:pyridoxamine 5'-phosphate oxidase family protein n=1 Tax=Actinomadura luteofluorescens TaxID=46163 RepID=UPI00363F15B0
MSDRDPVEARDLDIYGAGELAWDGVREALEAALPKAETPVFLGTVRPDGRPHSAGVGALWHDGDLYVVSGPGTRKSRNLMANPACTVSVRTPVGDVVLEGEAERVTDPAVLEAVAAQLPGRRMARRGWRARRSPRPTARRARASRRGTSTGSPSTRCSRWGRWSRSARCGGRSRADPADHGADRRACRLGGQPLSRANRPAQVSATMTAATGSCARAAGPGRAGRGRARRWCHRCGRGRWR